jgi:hypothetical protein
MKYLKKKLSNLLRNNIFRNIWPIFLIICISLTFFYPVLLQGKDALPTDALVGAHTPWIEVEWSDYPAGVPIKNQEITDAISQFYPWRSLVGKYWRAGRVPLWNPFLFSGTPFLATLHSATLYPLNAIYLFMNDINSWNMLVFLQVLLAGVFMYLLLHELGIKKVAALLGSIAFSLSGYMVAWLEFATGGHAGLWLPLLLFFELRLVKSSRTMWLVPISLVFFFIFTAGDFQVPLYICITYLLFGACLEVQKKGLKKIFTGSFITIVIGLIVGVLLSSIQLIPTIELFMRSVRVDDPYISDHFFGLMHWKKVTNFIWPDFYGNVVTRNYWAEHGYHEYLAFSGVITLCFGAYSLIVRKAKHETFFWVLLTISLVLLFPTPIAFLPYKLSIPALGTSSASRIIFLVNFCLAVLGAYGFSKWIENQDKKLYKIILWFGVMSLGVALGLMLSVTLMNRGKQYLDLAIIKDLKVSLRNMIPSSLILISFGIFVYFKIIFYKWFKHKFIRRYLLILFYFSVVVISTFEMLHFAWKNTPFSPRQFLYPKTETIAFLQEQQKPFRIAGRGIPLNYFMQYDIASAEGYDPIYPIRNAEWFSAVNFGHSGNPSRRYGQLHNFASPLLNYANVHYIVDYKKNTRGELSDNGSFSLKLDAASYKKVFSEGRVSVFQNLNELPYIWLSTNYHVVNDRDEVIKILESDDAQGEGLIVVDSSPEFESSKDKVSYKIGEIKKMFNEINFDITSDKRALLFLSESYQSGWRAYVNGEETKIFESNYLFQSIQVPEGTVHVKFLYDPTSFKIGMQIAGGAAVLLLLIVFYDIKKRVSEQSSRKGST